MKLRHEIGIKILNLKPKLKHIVSFRKSTKLQKNHLFLTKSNVQLQNDIKFNEKTI